MTNLEETVEFKKYNYNIVTCPICGHETLDNYWICEHCDWEYDGTTSDEQYSAVNNSTVGEYKEQYGRV